jgi:peptide-methionine (S)-S-oxide reductase
MNTTSCRIPIPNFPDPAIDLPLATSSAGRQVAVFAGGCFWCVEAVFNKLIGVESVRSGYAGGTAETANYKTVCGGRTDHAEVIEILYDPSKVTFGQLLKIHFSIAHDPTELNRQGNDVGRQYRSAVFFANEDQRRVAEAYIRQLNDAGVFNRPIVTTLEPLKDFFVAEAYHQNYAALNPGQPYIQYVAQPKVDKLRDYFGDRLKEKV